MFWRKKEKVAQLSLSQIIWKNKTAFKAIQFNYTILDNFEFLCFSKRPLITSDKVLALIMADIF